MTDIAVIIRDIGLALNACHNTITTDDVNANPKEDYSWRIDHRKELALLSELERFLINDIDTCPLCGCCNKCL